MKNAVVLFFMVFYASLVLAAEGKPSAVLPETEYHFPPVVDGTTVTHDFVLKNVGTADLVIEKLESG
ncbi:MAG TPA: DUF1573 domain-containing protein [Deltaproteobacteria bacterium]|nr:DUF1573 domain-containing protein [Deltaproteobacteria bacterium]